MAHIDYALEKWLLARFIELKVALRITLTPSTLESPFLRAGISEKDMGGGYSLVILIVT